MEPIEGWRQPLYTAAVVSSVQRSGVFLKFPGHKIANGLLCNFLPRLGHHQVLVVPIRRVTLNHQTIVVVFPLFLLVAENKNQHLYHSKDWQISLIMSRCSIGPLHWAVSSRHQIIVR